MAEMIIQLRAAAAGVRLSARQLIAVGLVAGLLLGLSGGLYIGWVAWPVSYAGEVSMPQRFYVDMVADLFAFDRNQERARRAMDWPGAGAATCALMESATDDARRLRLWTLLLVMNEGCDG